ncbi:ubiquinol oxidase subunit II [uncultured Methylobacterium sp.]|uniref:ubiquinol oxidase subunit II n=1 Tax=uncultured Methylobacterium sp. TaxID=157278 RepID=UPI002609FB27|nr:ubiquinol oxidase subunit II [uncultured Methylobacterium sp.]
MPALGAGIVLAVALAGCKGVLDKGVLDPQGPVGLQQRTILLNATAVMLAIVVPVALATLAFAWWFRDGNARARYRPDWSYSGRIEFVVWSIPALVILFLGGMTWIATHDLDPARPLRSARAPLTVEVVSLDWKWLFIYPDRGIAAVNRLVVPAGTPISFRLTSASVMNSFFVPQLGSQIYTMAGMQTRLHLLADRPGTYRGLSAQYSGSGFSDMGFEVVAKEPDAFEAWVSETRGRGETLDRAGYDALARPSQREPTREFGAVAPNLFDTIMKSVTASSAALICAPPKQAAELRGDK